MPSCTVVKRKPIHTCCLYACATVYLSQQLINSLQLPLLKDSLSTSVLLTLHEAYHMLEEKRRLQDGYDWAGRTDISKAQVESYKQAKPATTFAFLPRIYVQHRRRPRVEPRQQSVGREGSPTPTMRLYPRLNSMRMSWASRWHHCVCFCNTRSIQVAALIIKFSSSRPVAHHPPHHPVRPPSHVQMAVLQLRKV